MNETENLATLAWWSPGLTVKQRAALFISMVGGAGNVPKGPGTAGSLVAAGLYFVFVPFHPYVQLVALVIAFAVGLWGTKITEQITGRHDDGRIVVDELIGMWITLLWLPITFKVVAVGFVLFRVFDIMKPFPINFIDRRVKGALGVILDDAVAGIFGRAILAVTIQMWAWA